MPFEMRNLSFSDAFWFQEGPGVRNTQFKSSGIKLLNVSNITKDGQIDLEKTDRHLDEYEALGKYAHFIVDEGDLVIASSGISLDDDGLLRTRGAFIELNHLPLCMNTSTIRFKAIKGKSDLSFLRHWLQSSEFREQISRLVTGTAQKNFGPSHLKALKINLPSLEEQKRIAAILDQADDLRLKRQHAIDRLNQLGQAIFHEMFGKEGTTVRISEYLDDIQSGKNLVGVSDDDESGFRVLKISAVSRTGFRPSETKPLPSNYIPPSEHFVSNGDLIFSRANTTELIGIPCIVEGVEPNVALPDKLWRLVAAPQKADRNFLNFALRSPSSRQQIEKMCSGTSGSMQNISMQKFNSILIPKAHLGDQKKFAERVCQVSAVIQQTSVQQRTTKALFASLHHRAFAGEL